jgi:hypothetical protein
MSRERTDGQTTSEIIVSIWLTLQHASAAKSGAFFHPIFEKITLNSIHAVPLPPKSYQPELSGRTVILSFRWS